MQLFACVFRFWSESLRSIIFFSLSNKKTLNCLTQDYKDLFSAAGSTVLTVELIERFLFSCVISDNAAQLFAMRAVKFQAEFELLDAV